MLRLLRKLFGGRAAPPPPADPRLAADPWLGRIFALLGERYQLGPDGTDGARVLRRTGRARFNEMPVWLRAPERLVRGDYEVRGDPLVAKALLDQRVSRRLSEFGLTMSGEATEEWAGTVLTRRYEGRCDAPEQAAAAVRFVCQESETQIDLAAE